MSYYPAIEEIMRRVDNAEEKEKVILETRKSWRSILSSMLLFFVAAVAIIALNVFFPDANLLGLFSSETRVSIRWLAVIPAILLIEIIRKYHDDLYIFTPHTLTHYDGRLSLNFSVPNIRFIDVRAVICYQDILGRLLDYGDLEVDTAAQERSEMYLVGVRSPRELGEIIEALRTRSRKGSPGEGAPTNYYGSDD